MRGSIWLAVVVIAGSGCGAAYEPVRRPAPDVTSPDARPVEARPAAIPSQPGCQELSHQPFPTFGNEGPVDELPEAITKVPPTYPAGHSVEGTVLVRALVCEHGRVVKTEIVKSIPMLDEAAGEAMMQWTFKPALRGGQPVAVWVAVPVRFPAN